jgi:hypothetical protein
MKVTPFERLCFLIDDTPAKAADRAVAIASRFHRTKEIADAWKMVRDLLQVPLHYADAYYLKKVRERLGAPIAVALYRYYLRMLEKYGCAPDYLMSERELLTYSREAELTEDEYERLRALQLRVATV